MQQRREHLGPLLHFPNLHVPLAKTGVDNSKDPPVILNPPPTVDMRLAEKAAPTGPANGEESNSAGPVADVSDDLGPEDTVNEDVTDNGGKAEQVSRPTRPLTPVNEEPEVDKFGTPMSVAPTPPNSKTQKFTGPQPVPRNTRARTRLADEEKQASLDLAKKLQFDLNKPNTVKPQLKAPFWMTRNLKRGLKLGDSSTKLDDTKIFNFLWAKAESVGIKNERRRVLSQISRLNQA